MLQTYHLGECFKIKCYKSVTIAAGASHDFPTRHYGIMFAIEDGYAGAWFIGGMVADSITTVGAFKYHTTNTSIEFQLSYYDGGVRITNMLTSPSIHTVIFISGNN